MQRNSTDGAESKTLKSKKRKRDDDSPQELEISNDPKLLLYFRKLDLIVESFVDDFKYCFFDPRSIKELRMIQCVINAIKDDSIMMKTGLHYIVKHASQLPAGYDGLRDIAQHCLSEIKDDVVYSFALGLTKEKRLCL